MIRKSTIRDIKCMHARVCESKLAPSGPRELIIAIDENDSMEYLEIFNALKSNQIASIPTQIITFGEGVHLWTDEEIKNGRAATSWRASFVPLLRFMQAYIKSKPPNSHSIFLIVSNSIEYCEPLQTVYDELVQLYNVAKNSIVEIHTVGIDVTHDPFMLEKLCKLGTITGTYRFIDTERNFVNKVSEIASSLQTQKYAVFAKGDDVYKINTYIRDGQITCRLFGDVDNCTHLEIRPNLIDLRELEIAPEYEDSIYIPEDIIEFIIAKVRVVVGYITPSATRQVLDLTKQDIDELREYYEFLCNAIKNTNDQFDNQPNGKSKAILAMMSRRYAELLRMLNMLIYRLDTMREAAINGKLSSMDCAQFFDLLYRVDINYVDADDQAAFALAAVDIDKELTTHLDLSKHADFAQITQIDWYTAFCETNFWCMYKDAKSAVTKLFVADFDATLPSGAVPLYINKYHWSMVMARAKFDYEKSHCAFVALSDEMVKIYNDLENKQTRDPTLYKLLYDTCKHIVQYALCNDSAPKKAKTYWENIKTAVTNFYNPGYSSRTPQYINNCAVFSAQAIIIWDLFESCNNLESWYFTLLEEDMRRELKSMPARTDAELRCDMWDLFNIKKDYYAPHIDRIKDFYKLHNVNCYSKRVFDFLGEGPNMSDLPDIKKDLVDIGSFVERMNKNHPLLFQLKNIESRPIIAHYFFASKGMKLYFEEVSFVSWLSIILQNNIHVDDERRVKAIINNKYSPEEKPSEEIIELDSLYKQYSPLTVEGCRYRAFMWLMGVIIDTVNAFIDKECNNLIILQTHKITVGASISEYKLFATTTDLKFATGLLYGKTLGKDCGYLLKECTTQPMPHAYEKIKMLITGESIYYLEQINGDDVEISRLCLLRDIKDKHWKPSKSHINKFLKHNNLSEEQVKDLFG